MTMPVEWRIPPSVMHWLDRIPQDRPVVMLMRHSVRDELPPGDAGYTLPITEVGRRLALELGALLGGRLRSLRSSPLLRCVQTAEALSLGAQKQLEVTPDRLLGDPGVYVIEDQRAGRTWEELGHEAVMAQLVEGDSRLPGLADAEASARYLVRHMLASTGGVPGIHGFLTHDSLVTTTAARLLRMRLGKADWPWYLEAAFFWQSEAGTRVAYRAWSGEHSGALCDLTPTDLICFARREVAAVLGLACPARFFLAGGAFKSLLTGHAPRDLDLWAPSAADRAMLVTHLLARGAARLERRPFADAFQLGDRVIEVPDKVVPDTLEARLERFDLILSAVGVEHLPGDAWRAVAHPQIRESLERREVRLVKPLPNPGYVLSTLERARRYARELGFTLPSSEEALCWAHFAGADASERARMIEWFEGMGTGGGARPSG